MATIKPIEARSVHQIQSGQVIVDLCSVVKELVENSLDAGATSIDVRFKNNGLDLIEIQDNGHGISPNNYESLALKHYTSKLSTFADLTELQTFGFRGEALSSLCAVSNLKVITAEAEQAPRASKLDFEFSGKLKSTQVVAGQKGTTVSVENLFKSLPVRRRELEKNVKREYGKVLALLHAYACISTGVRFNVKNQMPKGKSVVVFTTKSNPTTRENISNVYGAKTLLALMPLDLDLEFEPSPAAKRFSSKASNKIFVHGHISKPVFGEGRQTPDRQMFFVNSRPCGLPQIAKAFNEVYKSFNLSQSPFIFANFEMDTAAYDVNVSPDKRTIMLHDAGALIECLKASLTELFEQEDQTVPVSQLAFSKKSEIRPPRQKTPPPSTDATQDNPEEPTGIAPYSQELGESDAVEHNDVEPTQTPQSSMKETIQTSGNDDQAAQPLAVEHDPVIPESSGAYNIPSNTNETEGDRSSSQPQSAQEHHVSRSPSLGTPTCKPGIVQNAFDRMRMNRTPVDVATITIGNKTYQSTIGREPVKRKLESYPGLHMHSPASKTRAITVRKGKIGRSFQSFAAPGTQQEQDELDDDLIEDEENKERESVANFRSEQEEEEEEEEAMEDNGEHEEMDDERNAGENQEERHQVESLQQDRQTMPGDIDSPASDSDESYVDDEERKSREDAKVNELIRAAEEASAVPSEQSIERAERLVRKPRKKDSTHELICTVDTSIAKIESQLKALRERIQSLHGERITSSVDEVEDGDQQIAPETKLSLAVSKADFSKMRIIGQFNLGFILAIRPGASRGDNSSLAGPSAEQDELFIIDQHASDEKYNFERLQAETTVQNQRLVQPKTLDLTAVEEEVIIENLAALEKNGFIVEIDTSGDEPIGRRCKLISLPLSKEVVFNTRDLEELIVLLSEAPQQSQNHHGKRSMNEFNSDAEGADIEPPGISSPFSDHLVPRPSKVRKMFAMRACRSSIMIGKNLTHRQMESVVKHMGTIDKPWNCPHGRPTMRHLVSLGQWNEWSEWDSHKERRSRAGKRKKSIKHIWEEFVEDYGS
ncbi:ATP-binding mismatch repair protein [Microsporum canis]